MGGIIIGDDVDRPVGDDFPLESVEKADEFARRWRCMQRPMTVRSSTLSAANRMVVPCGLWSCVKGAEKLVYDGVLYVERTRPWAPGHPWLRQVYATSGFRRLLSYSNLVLAGTSSFPKRELFDEHCRS